MWQTHVVKRQTICNREKVQNMHLSEPELVARFERPCGCGTERNSR
jgi:hypothetical protein